MRWTVRAALKQEREFETSVYSRQVQLRGRAAGGMGGWGVYCQENRLVVAFVQVPAGVEEGRRQMADTQRLFQRHQAGRTIDIMTTCIVAFAYGR